MLIDNELWGGEGINLREDHIKKLMNWKSLYEFLTMYLGLSYKEKLSVIGDDFIIPNDMVFYRVRKDIGKPLINESDWWMPPQIKTSQGRFNYAGKPVLYLGTMDSVLPREVGLNSGDVYYIAKYRCKNSFRVGSLLKTNDIINYVLHKVAIALVDYSILIAVERRELKYQNVNLSPWDIVNDFSSSYYLHHSLRRNLYDITNKISDLIISRYECGLRYCSCYVPIEMSGGPQVLTLDGEKEGNYALTNAGIKNLEWMGVERRIYTEDDYKKNDMSLFISSINKQGEWNGS